MQARLTRWVRVLLLCAAALAYTSGKGGPRASNAEEEVDEFLREFVAKRERLRDYSARFTQTKRSSLFDETEVSTGMVYYLRPGKILWDYRSPDVMKVLVKHRTVSIYIEELEQLEIYDFTQEKKMRGLFLGFDESPEELKTLYDITLVDPGRGEEGRCVQLVPKTEELRSYFDSVRLWLRRRDFAIYKILIIDSDPLEEGETSITLARITVNKGVRPDVFEIKVPEGTEIIEYRADEHGFEEKASPTDEAR